MCLATLFKGFFLFLMSVFAMASDYQWPTNATRLLSGTFGETRSAHFHSGIDIKTWAQKGYECYAPADGYIERVTVSPYGYGKALYIHLRDQRIAVFAHLDSFYGPIADRVCQEQSLSKKVFLDLSFPPGAYPVKKGEIVAYSGNSGTVVPHIHFELRDSMNYPINPLLNGFPIKDNIAPEPVEIAFVPLGPNARVNGSLGDMIFPLESIHGNLYTVADTIYLYGTYGINLKAWDRANNAYNKNGVYSISLFLDGKNIFESQFDILFWDYTHWMNEDRNYRLSYEGNGIFYKLYTSDLTKVLSFYKQKNKGYLIIDEGTHLCEIFVRDAMGNESCVKIPVKGMPTPQNPCTIKKIGHEWFVILDSTYWINHSQDILKIDHYNSLGSLIKEQTYPLRSIDMGIFTLYPENETAVFLCRILPNKGPALPPVLTYIYPNETYPKSDISIIPRHFSQGILFDIKAKGFLPPSIILSLEGRMCNALKWEPISVNQGRTTIIPVEEFEIYDYLNVYNYQGMTLETVWQIMPQCVKFTDHVILSSSDSLFEVNIAQETFFRDVLTWIVENEASNNPEGGKILSTLYSLHPMDQPLNCPLEIVLKTQPGYVDDRSKGLYCKKDEGTWSLIQERYDAMGTCYRSKVQQCGTYAILEDTMPPILNKMFPEEGGRYRAETLKEAWIEVTDNLSGIDPEEIQVFLNGTWMIYYYNDPTGIVSVKMPEILPRGKNTLWWNFKDKAGHTQGKSINFYVIG